MAEVLDAVRERADIVLVDTPGLAAASDALSLSPYIDTALFVVRLNASRRDEVARGIRELTNLGVDLAGVVVVGGARRRVPKYEDKAGGAGDFR